VGHSIKANKMKYDEQFLNGPLLNHDGQQVLIEETMIAQTQETYQQNMANANAKRYMNNNSQMIMQRGPLLDETGEMRLEQATHH
jgi:hypothetical protein